MPDYFATVTHGPDGKPVPRDVQEFIGYSSANGAAVDAMFNHEPRIENGESCVVEVMEVGKPPQRFKVGVETIRHGTAEELK